MEAETLEERYSPEELKRLRGKLEGLRENLVSAAVREAGLRKRQVTVGRTSLGECLRQLREAQEGFLNLLEKSLILIDRVELLREREAQRKKKKSPRTTRLEAANQDGGGGNNKTVPPGQSEGQTGGPEEQQHPQHLHPPLAPKETLPEEEGREGSGLQKSEMEGDQQPDLQGEDQDPGDDAGDQVSGDDSNGDGSECSNDGKEASDPQKSGAGGEAQDSGDEESEENSEDVCSDKDEDSEDNSDVDDYDEDKDMGVWCDALWADVGELEQKVGIMQNVSQEEVDALNAKVHDFFDNLRDIMWEVGGDLKKKVIHLWSFMWEIPLQAVAALQETLNSFLPVELTALKKESDSLRGFLQAIQSQDTVEKLAGLIVSSLAGCPDGFSTVKVECSI
ncbi:uncharacterized protein LOC121922618 [Sceloporus undulatus]|uniref:uncharacterized protein LOC121922618 n=1 Tax=Sceloporus undulatus TaxID=8520 RepID=UPI001C4BA13A|nr:uncharacterized protein LOC121922618 [Sceloporus undulatus]